MKNDFVDPKVIHSHFVFCREYGGPKDCNGYLHRISFNLYDENGFGWVMTISNSKHESLACCDVEYIEQIFTLIDIYKNY